MAELLFLPSVYTECPDCHGTRYKASTLEITWRDRNIAQILSMSVEDAHAFFDGEEEIMRSLSALIDVGLGYLRLGQPATELSGGEAQRGDTFYVLDEPTSGLHCADADRLVTHLQTLVDAGNTVVMVELDMRVVAASDHVIDLGRRRCDAPLDGHAGSRAGRPRLTLPNAFVGAVKAEESREVILRAARDLFVSGDHLFLLPRQAPAAPSDVGRSIRRPGQGAETNTIRALVRGMRRQET
ncbi:hypothetical protein [Streptomyces bauhiniae]|uniref:hypothetical protein n=1 Tax=Streptomyces bauhiniae TaxID=2340725 RepID=UPI001ABF2232